MAEKMINQDQLAMENQSLKQLLQSCKPSRTIGMAMNHSIVRPVNVVPRATYVSATANRAATVNRAMTGL